MSGPEAPVGPVVRRVPRRVRLFAPERPINPQAFPFYYGWVLVVVGIVAMLGVAPAAPPAFAPFVDLMMAELPVSRSDITFGFMAGTIGAGLLIPFAGRWIDQLGARLAAMIGCIFLGASTLYMSRMVEIARHLGVGGEEGRILTVFLFFLGFLGMRFFGMGLLMTSCRTMLFRWFTRRRSFVAAINGVFLSLAFSSSPLVLEALIAVFSWRGAWLISAAGTGVGVLLLVWIFFRDSPEACGIPVDGSLLDEGPSAPDESAPGSPDLRAGEATRTPAFWILCVACSLNGLIGTGVAFNIISLGADLGGLPRDEAIRLMLFAGICNCLGTVVLGLTAERIRMKHLVVAMVLCQGVSLTGVLNLSSAFGFVLFVAGSGLAWALFGIILSVAWPRFFGRTHLGAINGIVTGWLIVFSAIGPYFFGLLFDLTGGYEGAVLACLLLVPVVAVLSLFADNPRAAPAT